MRYNLHFIPGVKCKKEGKISEDEWNNAKSSLIYWYRIIGEHYSNLLDFSAGQYLLGDTDNPKEIVSKIEEILIDEVRAAAGSLECDTIFELS